MRLATLVVKRWRNNFGKSLSVAPLVAIESELSDLASLLDNNIDLVQVLIGQATYFNSFPLNPNRGLIFRHGDDDNMPNVLSVYDTYSCKRLMYNLEGMSAPDVQTHLETTYAAIPNHTTYPLVFGPIMANLMNYHHNYAPYCEHFAAQYQDAEWSAVYSLASDLVGHLQDAKPGCEIYLQIDSTSSHTQDEIINMCDRLGTLNITGLILAFATLPNWLTPCREALAIMRGKS